MRVSTAFNRLLQIPGASVTDVVIGERDVEVTLRPKARLTAVPVRDAQPRRPMTGGGAAGDTSTWARHRLWLVYEIRRLDCPDCGVRTEELPWARPAHGIPAISRTWCCGWPSAPTAPRWPP